MSEFVTPPVKTGTNVPANQCYFGRFNANGGAGGGRGTMAATQHESRKRKAGHTERVGLISERISEYLMALPPLFFKGD